MRSTGFAVAACVLIGCGPTPQTATKSSGEAKMKGEPPPRAQPTNAVKFYDPAELRSLPEGTRRKVVDDGHYYTPRDAAGFDAYREIVAPRLIERIKGPDPKDRISVLNHVEREVGDWVLPETREAVFRAHLGNWEKPDQAAAALDFFLDRFAGLTPLLQAIAQAVGDPEPRVRDSAARTLALLGPRAKAVRPDVERLLTVPGEVRCLAAETLWWIARDVSIAGPLSEELASKDRERSRRAKLALVRMKRAEHRTGYDGGEVVKVLRERFSQPKTFGPDHSDAIFAAQKHLVVSPDDYNRLLAEKGGALEDVLLTQATAMSTTVSRDPAFRREWEDTNLLLGDRVKALVPGLTKALGDPDPKVRLRAAEVLKGFGPLAKEAVPTLLKGLTDVDLDARYAAAQAIKAIDPETAKKALIP